jgi:hypothetical protein
MNPGRLVETIDINTHDDSTVIDALGRVNFLADRTRNSRFGHPVPDKSGCARNR